MNPNLLAALEAPTFDTAPVPTPSADIGEILGKNLANVIPKAINSLGGSLEGILNFQVSPESRMEIPEIPMWAESPQLTEAATGGEKLTNLLTGGILPELAALFIPYVGFAKAGKAAGLGRVGQVVAGNVGQGVTAGIKYGPEEAIEYGALGGVLSGIGTIPGVMRRAAITAPLAGLEYALHQDEGEAEAATAAATTLLGGILPSISGPRRGDIEVLPPEPLGLPYDPRRYREGAIPSGEPIATHPATLPTEVPRLYGPQAVDPSARHWQMLEWPHGEARTFTPSGEPIPMPGPEPIFMPAKRAAFEDIPVIGQPGGHLTNLLRNAEIEIIPPREVAWIEAEMPGIAISRDVPRSNVRTSNPITTIDIPNVQVQTINENVMEAAKEAGRRGKLRDLPEYQRTSGGMVLPEVVNTLGQVGVGATLGAIADPYVDEAFGMDVNTAGLGAGLPIALQFSKLAPQAFGIGKNLKGVANPFPEGLPNNLAMEVDEPFKGSINLHISKVEDGINYPVGDINGYIEGKYLKVVSTELEKTYRGQKIGLAMYDRLIDEAEARGLKFASDNSVSSDAAKVYEALERRGYKVTKNPEAKELQIGSGIVDGRKVTHWVTMDGEPVYKVEPPVSTGGMRQLQTAKAGFIAPELTASLAGGAAGGLTGFAMSEGDPFAAGAGALLGAAGTAALVSTFKSPGFQQTAKQAGEELQAAKATAAAIPKTGKVATDLTNSLKSAAKDLTEGNTYGQGGAFSRVFDFVDKQFRATMTPETKAVITRARGEVARLSERAMAYVKPYLSSGTPQSLIDKANRYLDGIGNSITDEVNFLRANGAIDDLSYDQLTPTQRKGFTTWRVSEDMANPKGVGSHQAFKMHVPISQLDSLKNQWNAKLTQDFLASTNVDERPAAEAIVKARENFNEIQRIFERALPAGPTQQLVTESVGRYVPRLFRAFTDKDFKVTDADIQSYLSEFGLNKRADLVKDSIVTSQAYDAQTFTNLLNRPNQTQAAQQRLQQYVPYTVDGRTLYVLPHIKDRFEALKNDKHLENMVRSHLQELGASERVQRTGAATGGLDPTLFKQREDLTPGYRKLLGEFTDPMERMAMAFSRTFAPAQAASLMDLAKNIQLPSGLKSAYEPAEWAKALEQATLSGNQKLAQELRQMKLIGKSASFGEYAGNYVNRHLADYFEGGAQIWNQSIGRGIAEFNKLFKTGHVPLNPISHVRQIASIPAFLAIGKAAPQDVRQAWNALFAGAREERTLNALTRDELLSVGAWTSDLIKGELQGNIDTFLSGRYDSELMKSTKGVVNSVLEAYRKPDMLVRAATYLGAKRRALDSGLSLEEAKAAAIQWMDRYTMNYDNIAPAVRFMRNVPGVSPFISYQAEMVRLVKNMLADGINGNPERLGTLALITAIPLGAATLAEQSLTPEEKKEWAQTKSLMPDYSQGKILLPTGKNPNGSMKYWDISPVIAQSDLIRLVSNLATGNTSAALEQNPFVGVTSSPILQALAKVTTQRDPRTNQELGSGSEAALSAIGDILPPITPGVGYEWKRLANVDVENLYTGRKESWGDWATRLVTGVSGSSARLSTLQDSLKKEFSRTAANARAEYLRTARLTGDNPGLDARKQAAYEEYRETMAQALQEFQERFQVTNQGPIVAQ